MKAYEVEHMTTQTEASTISTPVVAHTPGGHVAFIPLQIPKAAITEFMGPAIHEVFQVIAAQGAQVAGCWFTVHHSIQPESWNFDVCVPTQNPVVAEGRVQPKVLQPHRAATAIHTGPYEGLPAAWPALRAWVDSQGFSRTSWLCEAYEVGPETGLPPSQWKTRLYQPLTD